MRSLGKLVSTGMVLVMTATLAACGGKEKDPSGESGGKSADIPAINEINLGEDYQDISASVKILTNRTDVVDTVYAGYAEEFMKLYPNIEVAYEAITDYEETLTLRLSTGDWGDICFIPNTVDKSELSEYFISLGSSDELEKIYNYCSEKSFGGEQYGIANGGTADGVLYNKRIWEEAGVTEVPKTPDEFLDALQKIKDNTDATPLYTNFSAGWPMGAWDAYISIAATGDADYKNDVLCHTKDPFAKQDDMTGPYAVYYMLYESVARGLIEQDPASTDWETSKGLINKGEVASMVLGSWSVEQCKEVGDTPEDLGYMPFPITIDGKQYAGAAGNYSFGINKNSDADTQIASMLYVKWLIEESSIYEDEGSIPALKAAALPECLKDFEGIEMLSDNAAREGEESLFNDINNESEVGIGNDDFTDCAILEAALYGTRTLDEIMDEWNQKWTAAQESLGVELYE